MWEEQGIEGKPHFKSLLYNESAKTLVAHFQRRAGLKHWIGEIYTRPLDGKTYHKVAGSTDLVSFEQPVSAASSSLIFFNELQHRTEDPSGADWSAVRCLDLASERPSTVCAIETLQVPDGCKGIWISSVMSADADGQRLLCRVAFMHAVSEIEEQVEYWLCELPVRTAIPRKLCRLHNPFF